jgi:hypothetical protein
MHAHVQRYGLIEFAGPYLAHPHARSYHVPDHLSITAYIGYNNLEIMFVENSLVGFNTGRQFQPVAPGDNNGQDGPLHSKNLLKYKDRMTSVGAILVLSQQ